MTRVLQVLGPSTGGIRVHVASLANHLVSVGIDSPVVGPTEVMAGLGAQAGVVEVPVGLSPVGLVHARHQLRPWRRSSEVIHAHGLKAAWTAVGGHPSRPLVVTVHNVVIDESAGRSAALRRRLERMVLRRADRVIAPTSSIAEGLSGVVRPDRLRVIVPTSPAPVIRRAGIGLRSGIGVDDAAPLVVCVARLHPQKDLPTLLRGWSSVVAELPDARLVVVGEGPDRPGIESLCDRLAVSESVHLVGFDDHAVDWIATADVVAITSVWEAIPLVLAEAMSLGVAVVSTDVGLARELLGDGTTGQVVAVGDDAGLALALLRLLTDEGARRAAGTAAAALAAARFDPATLADGVIGVYEEVASVRGDRMSGGRG